MVRTLGRSWVMADLGTLGSLIIVGKGLEGSCFKGWANW